MKNCTKPISDPNDEVTLTPDIRAIMGIHHLYTQLHAAIESIKADDGLTDAARRLLILLEHPRRMGELARLTKLLPSTLTAQADHLEACGMVERERDPSDRRAWLLSLTEQGKIERASLVKQAGVLLREVTGFQDAEIEAFAALTDKALKLNPDTVIDGSDLC